MEYAQLYADAVRDHLADVRARRNRFRLEFTRPYLDGEVLPPQLEAYIVACAAQSAEDPSRFPLPLFAIIQSPGFGKSRLLRELSKRTKDDPHGRMKVLYTCVRPKHAEFTSPKYPEATSYLGNYLFSTAEGTEPERLLETKLVRVYEYAMAHWATVGNEWFDLFDEQWDADLRERIEAHQDDGIWSENHRILVLAIDEARYLMDTEGNGDGGWLRLLRVALQRATTRIRGKFGQFSSLLVVLVDSNPDIMGPSSLAGNTSELFTPFVLTQTMDIRFRVVVRDAISYGRTCKQFYSQLVSTDYETAWTTFVRMGRPLWDRVDRDDWNTRERPTDVIQLAADMLLGGPRASDRKSFTHTSLFGAASVLCRLGLRAATRSPLVPRLVADFLATLVYVSGSHDQFIATYSSEPVVTFAAARVWYQSASEPDAHARLSEHIIPHFRKLLRFDLVDTGGDHQGIVGRLVLLLAMDTTDLVVETRPTLHPREYAGKLHPIEWFLRVLYGDQPIVFRDGNGNDLSSDMADVMDAFLNKWGEWKVGFSHFVEMSNAPSEDELWAMLARRAAGVFPRDFDYVDLFIPISNGTAVSMILVQVDCRDRDVSPHATKMMQPSLLFTNELGQLRANEVVRVYMNLSGTTRNQYYLVDLQEDSTSQREVRSPVLCLEGLDVWHARPTPERVANSDNWMYSANNLPVLSQNLAAQLRAVLLAPTQPSVDSLLDMDCVPESST